MKLIRVREPKPGTVERVDKPFTVKGAQVQSYRALKGDCEEIYEKVVRNGMVQWFKLVD